MHVVGQAEQSVNGTTAANCS